MNADEVLAELQPLGSENYRRILANHGVTGPCYGVKIEELKKFQRKIKKNYRLALDLYDTGIYDAQYLAGLIADDMQMTREDLERWVEVACGPLAGFTVAWVAAGSPHGWEAALDWIDAPEPVKAIAGWATLSMLVSMRPDSELDLAALRALLERVRGEIQTAPDPVRYQMNSFIIALGSYVTDLSAEAEAAGSQLGRLKVDLGNTACQVPYAPDYIRKVRERGTLGKKRKTVKC